MLGRPRGRKGSSAANTGNSHGRTQVQQATPAAAAGRPCSSAQAHPQPLPHRVDDLHGARLRRQALEEGLGGVLARQHRLRQPAPDDGTGQRWASAVSSCMHVTLCRIHHCWREQRRHVGRHGWPAALPAPRQAPAPGAAPGAAVAQRALPGRLQLAPFRPEAVLDLRHESAAAGRPDQHGAGAGKAGGGRRVDRRRCPWLTQALAVCPSSCAFSSRLRPSRQGRGTCACATRAALPAAAVAAWPPQACHNQ